MTEAESVGVDLDEFFETDSVGGLAYELVYLRHRYRPEPHATGDALETFHERVIEPRVERLEQIIDPSDEMRAAYGLAVKIQHESRRFGPPKAGGRRQQPAWWLYVQDCVETAVERAEAASQREDAAANKATG